MQHRHMVEDSIGMLSLRRDSSGLISGHLESVLPPPPQTSPLLFSKENFLWKSLIKHSNNIVSPFYKCVLGEVTYVLLFRLPHYPCVYHSSDTNQIKSNQISLLVLRSRNRIVTNYIQTYIILNIQTANDLNMHYKYL